MNDPAPPVGPGSVLGPPLRGGDIVRAVITGLALFGLGFLLIGAVAASPETAGARINYLIAYFAAWSFAWLAAIWLVFIRGRGMSFADLGYTMPERVWAARGITFAFAALPLAYMLQAILRSVLDVGSGTNLQQYFGSSDFTIVHAATVLLYGGFLVPLAEEMVFRGLLFRWLRQRFEFWPAAFISAAAFGIAHVRADQVIVAGLLGLPMAWLYEKSRSLVPAILMHQAYNSLALMLTFAFVWFAPAPRS